MSETRESFDLIFAALKKQAKYGKKHQDIAFAQYLDRTHAAFTEARETAEAESKAGKLDETKKANYTKVAKALPEIAKGLNAAIKAFENEDAMEGAAALMDVCATVATTLGSLAAASSLAGPIGALVGALFGIAAMILRSFQPAQKSLGDVIEGKLRLLGAEGAHIEVQTSIDELETLYAGYPLEGKVEITHDMLAALAEGNAINGVLKAANWLLMEGNIKEQTIFEGWLNVLSAYVHAQSLQFRNLTHLLSIATAASYPALDRTYQQLAKIHLAKMRQLTPAARAKGVVWHIGTGGHLYKRQGHEGQGTWIDLGGEQTEFSFANGRSGRSTDVVAVGDGGRLYAKSFGKIWPVSGSPWMEIEGSRNSRDAAVVTGSKDTEFSVLSIRGNQVVATSVVHTKAKFAVKQGGETGFKPGLAGAKLLQVRVLPDYRPDTDEAIGYLLIEKDGHHQIQCASASTFPAFTFPLKWNVVVGMAVDKGHLWIWTASALACIGHTRLRKMRDANATAEEFRKAWVWQYVDKNAVPQPGVGGHSGVVAGVGLKPITPDTNVTSLAPSDDGTLMIANNSLLYAGTLSANQYSDTFNVEWQAIDFEARGSRIYKESIDCWPLFVKQVELLEDVTEESQPYWDPTMRAKQPS